MLSILIIAIHDWLEIPGLQIKELVISELVKLFLQIVFSHCFKHYNLEAEMTWQNFVWMSEKWSLDAVLWNKLEEL